MLFGVDFDEGGWSRQVVGSIVGAVIALLLYPDGCSRHSIARLTDHGDTGPPMSDRGPASRGSVPAVPARPCRASP